MKNSLEIFKNGVNIRLHNKEIDFIEIPDKDSMLFQFKFATDDAEMPSVRHECIKGKIRVTHISLSHQAIQSVVIAYNEYLKSKAVNNITPM